MPIRKCCVCNNLRQDAILYHFPCGEQRLKLWLKCIINNRVNQSLRNELHKLSQEQISKLFVCGNHFEKRFLTSKSRLVGKAYPSLFTEDEITSGVPSVENTENVNPGTEHNYTCKTYTDHTYCKQEPLQGDLYITNSPTNLDQPKIQTGRESTILDQSQAQRFDTGEEDWGTEEIIDEADMNPSPEVADNDEADRSPSPEVVDNDEADRSPSPEVVDNDEADRSPSPEVVDNDEADRSPSPEVVDNDEADRSPSPEVVDNDEADRSPSPEVVDNDEADRSPSPEVVEEAPPTVLPVQCVTCTKFIEKHLFVCASCIEYEPRCATCAEHQGAHAACYVLRANVTRPKTEILGVLCAIRSELAMKSFADELDDDQCQIKSETVEEVEETDVLDVDPFDQIDSAIVTGNNKEFTSSSILVMENEDDNGSSSDDESVASDSDSLVSQIHQSLPSHGYEVELDKTLEENETRKSPRKKIKLNTSEQGDTRLRVQMIHERDQSAQILPKGHKMMHHVERPYHLIPKHIKILPKIVQTPLENVQTIPDNEQMITEGAIIILPEGVQMLPEHFQMLPDGAQIILPEGVLPEHVQNGLMLPEGGQIILPQGVQIPPEFVQILPDGAQIILPEGFQMLPELVQMLPEVVQMLPEDVQNVQMLPDSMSVSYIIDAESVQMVGGVQIQPEGSIILPGGVQMVGGVQIQPEGSIILPGGVQMPTDVEMAIDNVLHKDVKSSKGSKNTLCSGRIVKSSGRRTSSDRSRKDHFNLRECRVVLERLNLTHVG